jgi:hypothetical protein
MQRDIFSFIEEVLFLYNVYTQVNIMIMHCSAVKFEKNI